MFLIDIDADEVRSTFLSCLFLAQILAAPRPLLPPCYCSCVRSSWEPSMQLQLQCHSAAKLNRGQMHGGRMAERLTRQSLSELACVDYTVRLQVSIREAPFPSLCLPPSSPPVSLSPSRRFISRLLSLSCLTSLPSSPACCLTTP